MISRKTLAGSLLVLAPAWSVVFTAPPARAAFVRGDVDRNGAVDITDAINILNFLFLGGPAPHCRPIANVNGDGDLDLTDPISLLSHLFLGAPAPSALSMDDLAVCKGVDPLAVPRGMQVYQNPDPNGNFTSCITCHGMVPDAESNLILAGHSQEDALRRPTWKGGRLTRFLEAANVCRKDWMATSPWSDSSPEFTDLVAFMEVLSPDEPRPALSYRIECDPQPGAPGDGPAGCGLFNRSCAVCHGMGAVGNDLLGPSLVDLSSVLIDDPNYIRTKIRRSGPSRADNPDVVYPCLTGQSTMPFWSEDKLSDAQVEDLIAFVALAREEKRKGNATFDCFRETFPPLGSVALRGVFRNSLPQYGVSGQAELVLGVELNDRRLHLMGFNYSGTGIMVNAWLFNQGSILDGKAVGPDLRRPMPYVDETVVIEIPPEHFEVSPTFKPKFDSVSIWCVVARVNFADARLEPVP